MEEIMENTIKKNPAPVSFGVSERAEKQIQLLSQQEKDASEKAFRIFLKPGGCSGFEYDFAFSAPKDTDVIIAKNGVKVAIEAESADRLHNSELDFVEEMMSSKFVIQNPNVTGTCGCGISMKF